MYTLADHPELVHKEYLPEVMPHPDPEVLRLLVPEKDRRIEGQPMTHWAAWPVDIVESRGRITGFLMPRLSRDFYFHDGGLRGQERGMAYLGTTPKPAWGVGVRLPNRATELRILEQFATALQQLHHRDVLIGDISFANVVWNATGEIRLLDCDSFTIRGRSVCRTVVETSDWVDPLGAGPSREADCFKLGLMVYRVLMKTTVGRPDPGVSGSDLPIAAGVADAVADLLRRTTGPVATWPTAQQWRYALSGRGSVAVTGSPSPPAATSPPATTPVAGRQWVSVAVPTPPPPQPRRWIPTSPR